MTSRATGILTSNGNADISDSSITYNVGIGGTTAGQYDQLSVTGNMNLGDGNAGRDPRCR